MLFRSSVFEILDELDSTEVAGIDAKLTEHTVAQIILIVSITAKSQVLQKQNMLLMEAFQSGFIRMGIIR